MRGIFSKGYTYKLSFHNERCVDKRLPDGHGRVSAKCEHRESNGLDELNCMGDVGNAGFDFCAVISR